MKKILLIVAGVVLFSSFAFTLLRGETKGVTSEGRDIGRYQLAQGTYILGSEKGYSEVKATFRIDTTTGETRIYTALISESEHKTFSYWAKIEEDLGVKNTSAEQKKE